MTERLVHAENNSVKRLGAFLSELLYTKESLSRRLSGMDNGIETLDDIIERTKKLFEMILDTVPDNQKRNIKNTFSDYKIALVPFLQPNSTSVIIQKDVATKLVDAAMYKCVGCVEDEHSCLKCELYNILEQTVTPNTYDSMMCPFARAEWADGEA